MPSYSPDLNPTLRRPSRRSRGSSCVRPKPGPEKPCSRRSVGRCLLRSPPVTPAASSNTAATGCRFNHYGERCKRSLRGSVSLRRECGLDLSDRFANEVLGTSPYFHPEFIAVCSDVAAGKSPSLGQMMMKPSRRQDWGCRNYRCEYQCRFSFGSGSCNSLVRPTFLPQPEEGQSRGGIMERES